jgi:hypothetical protein
MNGEKNESRSQVNCRKTRHRCGGTSRLRRGHVAQRQCETSRRQGRSETASVIGHLALPGASVIELVLQQRGSKQYLYVEQASKEGFAIVDVTNPEQPNVIRSEAWPNQASAGKLQMVAGRLALAEAPDTATAETVSSTETLTVLDLSDPANPRTILTFSRVTSTLADDERNLVYITNSDGLWILKHQPEQGMSSASRGCSSEDASNDLASCP